MTVLPYCVYTTGSQESFVHKLETALGTLWARFTISSRQHKPSFNVKKILSGFTQDIKWEISTEQVGTVIFVTHLIEYAFVGVSHLVNHW